MAAVGHFFLLWFLYTLGWFLGNAILSIPRLSISQMTMKTAIVFGLFTTVFHSIACHLIRNGFCTP